MICKSCGKEIPEGMKTCPYCLFDNEAITKLHMNFAEQPTSVHFLEQESVAKKRINPVVIVSIIVVCVTVLIVGVLCLILLTGKTGSNTPVNGNDTQKNTFVTATDFDAITSVEVIDFKYNEKKEYSFNYIRENDGYVIEITEFNSNDEYNFYETVVYFDSYKRLSSFKKTCYAKTNSEYQYYDEYVYNYNSNGQLVSKNYFSDNSSGTFIYEYNEEGRLLNELFEESYGPGWSDSYFYDDIGRLTCLSSGGTFRYESHYEYDGMLLTSRKLYNPEGDFYENYEYFGYSTTNKLNHYNYRESDYKETTLNEIIKNYQYDTEDKLSGVTVECDSERNGDYSLTGTYIYDRGLLTKIRFKGTQDFDVDFYYEKMPIEFDGLLDLYFKDQYGKSCEEYFFY